MQENFSKAILNVIGKYTIFELEPNEKFMIIDGTIVMKYWEHHVYSRFSISSELIKIARIDPIYLETERAFESIICRLLDNDKKMYQLQKSWWKRLKFLFKK